MQQQPGYIALVRSWDSGVYIVLDSGLRGWTILDDKGHGVAAAAEASGRKVWLKWGSYNPNWGLGQGYFEDVQIAFDWGVF